ncbi:MAG: helix-turn-helix transcriptional regulator [Eubacterium sp.]|nr:helix-turn-helix transcriptional regulator [Eubacterium sp.]
MFVTILDHFGLNVNSPYWSNIYLYRGDFLIYERIRNLREDLDMTQTDIANVLNISQRTYSRYENNERSIPIEVLSDLADFHKTSVDYLIGRTDEKRAYPRSSRAK